MFLEIKNVYKSYGTKEVLKGISFETGSGTALGILGRNGAGKTTIIRILMNVFAADRGEILIDGEPVDYRTVSFGYLPEERGLYPKRTIIEQLVYFAELKGMTRKEAVKAVEYWLRRMELSDQGNRKLETLSKGNQQKIQFITALTHDPDIIVLDEPFSGLDPVNAGVLKEIVREQIEEGKIVIFSSHQMNYVEEFCDRIAIIHQGVISITGDLYTIKREYLRNKLVIRSKDIEQIRSIYKDNTEKMGSHELQFTVPANEKAQDVMVRIINEFEIDEIRVYEPSLNDIFIEYTSEQDDKEGEGAA